MTFLPELHKTARSREIEVIFQDNKADIKADIDSLELSMEGVANKWEVSDRIVRRWCERLGIDPAERTKARRRAGKEAKRGYTHKRSSRAGSKYVQEAKPQAHKLIGLW